MKEIIHLINNSSKPLFKSSARLMTEIFTISRLNYKPDLLPLTSVCPLPEFPSQFSLNFNEVCIMRGETLWNETAGKNSVAVLWSGGIDSTCALVALILTKPIDGKITVYCNLNSLMENREFYQALLKFPFITFKNSSVIENEKLNLITGEMGDQIFGSDHIISIANNFGFKEIYSPYEKIIPTLFHNRGGEAGTILYEKYRPIVDEAPFKIVTAFDFVWWWNFTQKWQCIKFHQKSLLPPEVTPTHFFEDNDFQFWSVHNHELKIGQSMATYKMPAKEFIFSFDKNNSYHQNKKKFASPLGNNRYFYALFKDGSTLKTFEECNELINSLSPTIPW